MGSKNKQNNFGVLSEEEAIKYLNEHYQELCEGEEYISFTIANYALTDVVEALPAANVKDIIVTKVDDNLVVKYKPSWRA